MTIFVYSAGKLIAEYSTATPEPNPTTKWTVTDQLGSPRILVNSLGEVVSRRDFMPFGEEITPDGTHRTTNLKYNFGDNVRQKFTGYQKDEETQLDFAEARMYQNLHGRFTAVDPLLASGKSANPQTFNRYVYVMNNPLIFSDPTGLQAAQYTGPVYASPDGDQFNRVRVNKDWTVYSGPEMVFVGNGGYWWRVHSRGWTRLGKFEGAPVEIRPVPELIETNSEIPIGNITPRQGIEFIPGNNLSDDERATLSSEVSDMLSIPQCRQSFVNDGLRDPMSQKLYIGSVSQLENGSTAESLGLTIEGLQSSRAGYRANFSNLNAATASNNRLWAGVGNARTVDDNPRMFVSQQNFFGQRSITYQIPLIGSSLVWSSRDNIGHERQHGAGAISRPGFFGHDLRYRNPGHNLILAACSR